MTELPGKNSDLTVNEFEWNQRKVIRLPVVLRVAILILKSLPKFLRVSQNKSAAVTKLMFPGLFGKNTAFCQLLLILKAKAKLSTSLLETYQFSDTEILTLTVIIVSVKIEGRRSLTLTSILSNK